MRGIRCLRYCAAALALAALAWAPGALPASAQTVFSVGDAFTPDGEGGAYLGVRLVEETDHPEGGARVTHVVEDSPADEAGLEEDDIVVEFDGEIIRGPVALTKRIHAHEPGDRVSIKVLRDGREKLLEVDLGEREEFLVAPSLTPQSDRWNEWQEKLSERMEELGERLGESKARSYTLPGLEYFLSSGWGRPKLGVELVETTRELREHLGGDEDQGVLVSKVLDGTPAERAGIRVGDLILTVDGEPVASVGELREALEDKEGETFPVRVARNGRAISIEVTLPEPDHDRPTGPRAGLWAPCPVAPHAPPVALAPFPVLAPGPPPVPVAPEPPASLALPAPLPGPAPVPFAPAPVTPPSPAPPAPPRGLLV